MSRLKVTYGRCTRKAFLTRKGKSQLDPGKLYFLKDTGQIVRADSTSTYEVYSNKIHIVTDWPTEWVPENIYIRKATGRAKIVSEDGTIIELTAEGSGGGGGSGDISDLEADVASLKADVADIKEQLKWKDSNNV